MLPLEPLAVALEGTLLVEASAGTGKTHTITTLVARLVVERGIPIDRLLVVTFTEAATAELRDRVRRRLARALAAFDSPPGGGETDTEMQALADRLASEEAREEARRRLRRALDDLDLAGISTIHSFCRQALEEHAFESGARFDLDFVTDLAPLVQDVADDHWATQTYGLSPAAFALMRKKWTPEAARSLVTTLARWPASTRVLPEEAGESAPSATDLAQLRALFDEAASLWKRQRAPIVELLKSGVLDKGSYKPESIDGWGGELDAYFAKGSVFDFPGKMECFGKTKIASCLKKNQVLPTHDFFDVVQKLLDGHARALSAQLALVRRAAVAHTHRELARRKALGGVRSFDDLLQALDAALQGPRGEGLAEALRGRYSAALIDEFQDTDPTQYRIFRAVFHGKTPLLLVGDPKQSIYAFRGADIFSYLTAADDARSARYTLTTSYRSDPSLVRAVNTVFATGDDAFVFPEIPFHPITARAPADRIRGAGPAFEFLLAAGDRTPSERIPTLVAADIARLLRSGATIEGRPVVAADIAVLTRANKEAAAVQVALRELGIPSVLETEASVFESPEADALEAVLRAIAEPNRADRVKTALASALVGLSAAQIVELETSEAAWDRWSERFRALREVWQERGFIDMYRRLLRELGMERRLLSLFDGERRLTNLSHLAELVHRAALDSRLGMASLLQWFARMREDKAAQEQTLGSAAGELRIESDERAVKLLTIHKSKGLEYPIVYCSHLWWGLTRKVPVAVFHDEKHGRELTLHIEPDDPAREQRKKEELAEGQRVLYVALTRARHKLFVVWGLLPKASGSSLAYALHRPWKKKPTDETLRAELDQLVARAGGAIGLRELEEIAQEPLVHPETEGATLDFRRFDRTIDRRWRMTSFTALTKVRPGAAAPPEDDDRDRDEVEDIEAAPELGAVGTPASLPADITLADFPRGSKAGTMLHEVFELHDFTAPEADLRVLVEKTLPRHGFDAASLVEPLTRGVSEILATPLDAEGRLSLGALTRAQRLDEVEFVIPVAAGAGASPAFARSRLAEVFARHPTDTVPARYAERLRALEFGEMRGFLRGFVDLVFQHDGRFYVVDYKSNHLGRTAADYGPRQLAEAMTHAHYYLQYHLYVVALHRHLGRRLRDYSYERSFGGVYYLFARGMAPENGKAGVFFDRPPQARIDALSRCLEGLAREDAHV